MSKKGADKEENQELSQQIKRLKEINLEEDEESPEQPEAAPSVAERSLPREWRIPRDLSLDNIIGNIEREVSTRRNLNNFCENVAFVSQVEPKTVCDALKDDNWINAMHDELNQFAKNNVWTLVPRTKEMNVIGTK